MQTVVAWNNLGPIGNQHAIQDKGNKHKHLQQDQDENGSLSHTYSLVKDIGS